MNRLYELLFMLVLIVLLATTASALKPLRESMTVQEVNKIYKNVANPVVSGCTNYSSSSVEMIPNLDDLLSTNYLKPEIVKGMGIKNTIFSRSCSDDIGVSGSSLISNIESKKSSCQVKIDLQDYQLKSKTITLMINARDITVESPLELTIPFVQDENLLSLVLLRPIIISLQNSKPYAFKYNGGRFNFGTFNVPNVPTLSKLVKDNDRIVRMTLKEVSNIGYHIFSEYQNKNILDVINENKKILLNSGVGIISTITLPFVVYYFDIKEQPVANVVKVRHGSDSASVTDNPYMKSIITAFKKTPSLTNPMFSLSFKIRVASDYEKKTNYIHLLSIARSPLGGCSMARTGITEVFLVNSIVTRSQAYDTNMSETRIDDNFTKLAFASSNRDINTQKINNLCGQGTTLELWIPTNVNVDICYSFGPTFKVAVATFYDSKTRKRQMLFNQLNHCGNLINDTLQSIIQQDSIFVWNNTIGKALKAQRVDSRRLSVSDIELIYGLQNLYKWYHSLA